MLYDKNDIKYFKHLNMITIICNLYYNAFLADEVEIKK